jgi:hypothetical protein
MKEAFIKYQKAGFLCLPTKENKAPDVQGTWKGGLSDPEAYTRAHGIGIICGQGSGGLECIDFDNHFSDAKEILSSFLANDQVKEIYQKYKLPVESTLNGGFHLLYRCTDFEGNQKLAQRPKKEGDRWIPDTTIETRGEGGYFCADPTPGYKVVRNDLLNVSTITPDERDILLSTARSFNTFFEQKRNEYENKDRPGDIYNTTAQAIDEMKAALISAGWKELSTGNWQRPGKKTGISATLGKAAENIFYVFSSNAYPFESNSGYTPFQVVALLKYSGDFKAFAKELSEGQKGQPGKAPVKKQLNDYNSILNKSYIDLAIPVSKPPVIMKIRDIEGLDIIDKRLFTLGNFSVTTGKSKSKKTFLANFFLAAASGNIPIDNKFIPDIPDNKKAVILFDTEQSRYDSFITACRIPKILGYFPENFGAFSLREYSPIERCEIINYALEKKFRNDTGFVVIDGIVDLANAINDEDEATRVVSLLMKWTSIYNCHIHVIIHENKADSYATGHLGSALIKKAEVNIAVQKDPDNYLRSTVKCNLIRGGADFNDFDFVIDNEGLPRIEQRDPVRNLYEKEPELI